MAKNYMSEAMELCKAAGLPLASAPSLAAYNQHRDEGEPGQAGPTDLGLEEASRRGLKILEEQGPAFFNGLR